MQVRFAYLHLSAALHMRVSLATEAHHAYALQALPTFVRTVLPI